MGTKLKFKAGDRVKRRDGNTFSNSSYVVTVKATDEVGIWFKETDTWCDESFIQLAPSADTEDFFPDDTILAAASGALREKLDAERYDYMPALEVNEAFARVAAFGAQKYATDNWMKGLPTSQLFGSLMRHSWAWMRGEQFDNGPKGSGLLHTDHILWNAVALVYNQANLPQCDDRFENRLEQQSK